ncbi:MAG: NAD-dependent epimerase/dehydratase family protein [Candidatus Latescibacterota bacterium]|nr:MAG: NAD-dependent epimerase/dehydratase family protein [Candidatus Latescibacterota bacterium]
MTEKTFLVTGATGFVGGRFCTALKQFGRVRALVRSGQRGAWDESVTADLTAERSGELFQDAMGDVEAVFHLAGKTDDMRTSRGDERVFYRVNLDGTARLIEAAAAAGVGKFIYLSSIKAMGFGGGKRLDEDSPTQPTTPYGRSKRAAEEIVLGGGDIAHVCVLRASPVYGPGSKGNLTRMIRAVAKGVFPPVPDTGNVRSMVHVEDVVQALMLSAEKEDANGRVFIVTDGHSYSTRQIYEWICEALGRRVPAWRVPAGGLRFLARVGDGIGSFTGRNFVFNSATYDRLLGSAHYDSARIRDTLGYSPRWNLRTALPDMVRHVRCSV